MSENPARRWPTSAQYFFDHAPLPVQRHRREIDWEGEQPGDLRNLWWGVLRADEQRRGRALPTLMGTKAKIVVMQLHWFGCLVEQGA